MTDKPNKLERFKAKLSPADFADRLSTIDWNSVTEEERFYLKNYGIYNIKMRPDVYMLRLRIDGGRIDVEQLETIASLAQWHDLAIIVTARAQIELHGIAPQEVLPLYRRLQEAGISTHQTLTDNFRAIVTDPYDGAAVDSRIDSWPLVMRIRERILDRPEWMGTIPRKFNTAIIGRETPLVNPWANDLLFALAQREDAWGFNVYLGGKNTDVARPADLFVLPEAVPDLFMAVAEVFSQHGLRGSRAKIRLFHLIETVGMPQVRSWIEGYSGRTLSPAAELKMEAARYRTRTELGDGRYGEIVPTRYGETDADAVMALVGRAQKERLDVRLGSDQNFHLIGRTTPPPQSRPVAQIIACAGVRYCPLALWDIKRDIPALPLDRFARHAITVGFSGCLKGCGRHYHSDIGLFGLRTNLYGETERAVRVYIGALQSPGVMPGRMLYYSVPERRITALLETILVDYEEGDFGTFADYARHIRRYTVEWLQLWYLIRLQYRDRQGLDAAFYRREDEAVLAERAEALIGEPLGEEYAEAIRALSHRAWDRSAP